MSGMYEPDFVPIKSNVEYLNCLKSEVKVLTPQNCVKLILDH